MSKLRYILSNVLITGTAIICIAMSLTACKEDKLTVETMVGELSASDYYNWMKYESDVVNDVKLSEEIKKDIEERVSKIKDGTATDAEIERIKAEYGSVENYESELILSYKKDIARKNAEEGLEVTDADREAFIENYSNVFAGMNAIVFQFNTAEKANEFISANSGKSKQEVLSYISGLAGVNELKWDEVYKYKDKTGIDILHNSDSNMYNYCDAEILKQVFESITDGQMSGIFEYSGFNTVLWRISNNVIEKDDALVDNYMLEIKKEEAYKKYIIENK